MEAWQEVPVVLPYLVERVVRPCLALAALEVVQVELPCPVVPEVRLPVEQRCQPLPLRA